MPAAPPNKQTKELTKADIDTIVAKGDLRAARRLLAIEGDVPLSTVATRLKAALRTCCVYKVKAGGLVYTKHSSDASLDQYWRALQSMLEQLLQSQSEQAITLGSRLMVEAIKSERDIAQSFPTEVLQSTLLSIIVNVYDPDYAAAVFIGELANTHWDVYTRVLSYLRLVCTALAGVETSNTRPVIAAVEASGVDQEEILERIYTLLEAYAPPSKGICQTEPLDTAGKAACKGVVSLRKAFQEAWLAFLRLDLSSDLMRLVLRHLPSNVLPYLPSPQYLGDFYFKAFDGSDTTEDTTNSVLALSGLFYLLTQANIGDPSYIDNSLSAFYSRLYALLTPATLVLPYRHRFLRLLLLALKSPMLPGSSVAAFAKKLLRCAMLVRSHSVVMWLVTAAYTIMQRNPASCRGLVHDQGEASRKEVDGAEARYEEDPWKDEMSLDEAVKIIPLTSLWELQCLMRHHSPSVYRLAQLFRTNMFAETAKRISPDDMLVVTDKELFDREVNYQCKRGRVAPPAAIGFIRDEVQPIYQAADECFQDMSNRRAVSVKVHPLALLNISDHITRVSYADQSVSAVRGFLIGYSDGADIVITNSFQCVTDEMVCVQHACTRIRQYGEIFPNSTPVGWYSVAAGGPPSNEVHAFMEGIVGDEGAESLVALVVRSDNEMAWLSKESETLPIQAFEKSVDGSFIELDVRVCMEDEAENIAVSHVTKNAKQASAAGTYEHVVEPTLGAIAMLNKKVESLLEYIRAVQRQEVEVSRPLLRSISAICDQLTAMSRAGQEGTALRAHWDRVIEDSMTVALAAEGTANIAEFCATVDTRRIAAARAPKALDS